MAATVSPTANLQVLDYCNYEDWSFRVKVYLLAEDIWDVVEATTEPPKREDGEAEFKAWRKNNAKALLAIQTRCGVDTYPLIKGSRTAKAAWDTLAEELQPSDEGERDVKYDFLYDNLKLGDWNAAKDFISQHPESLTHRVSSNGGTALHEAIEGNRLNIVEELLKLMSGEDLEIEDGDGFTAFFYALEKGMPKIVTSMVEKNRDLVTKRFTNADDMTPVLLAYQSGHYEIARFLYSLTPREVFTKDNGKEGAELITQGLFSTDNFDTDIGWDFFKHNPELVLTKNYLGHSPLNALADFRSAFRSGVSLRFWERWIYNWIDVQPHEELEDDKRNQPAPTNFDVIRVNVEELEDDKRNLRDLISSVMGFFQGVVKNHQKLLGIHGLYEMKFRHGRIRQFLPRMYHVAKSRNLDATQTGFLQTAIFQAVKRGHVEFIKKMCQANEKIPQMRDGSGRTMFQYAVECRQEKVFNLIYGFSEDVRKASFEQGADKFNNSILHVAGSLSAHLYHIQGAALQMQRELQWFRAVENLLPPQNLEIKNVTDKMTARELFTRNHKELVKEGEKSMKGTATSCTVVGALIVTIMFAAAFTVPGGSNQDTGFPMFLRKKLFMVFLISDSISLVSSTTSVMIFLGILTSRYAEDDFLWSLPTKMILGLFTLFLSIATMMVAFSSTLLIMLEGETWVSIPRVSIPIFFLAMIPIIPFVWMQFPLFRDIFMSTYVRRIFDKKRGALE